MACAHTETPGEMGIHNGIRSDTGDLAKTALSWVRMLADRHRVAGSVLTHRRGNNHVTRWENGRFDQQADVVIPLHPHAVPFTRNPFSDQGIRDEMRRAQRMPAQNRTGLSGLPLRLARRRSPTSNKLCLSGIRDDEHLPARAFGESVAVRLHFAHAVLDVGRIQLAAPLGIYIDSVPSNVLYPKGGGTVPSAFHRPSTGQPASL